MEIFLKLLPEPSNGKHFKLFKKLKMKTKEFFYFKNSHSATQNTHFSLIKQLVRTQASSQRSNRSQGDHRGMRMG